MHLPVAEIVVGYRDGATLEELADIHGCSAWTIKHRLRLAGESLRRRGPRRTYTLNEEFFDDINTEAQAYWLGFLLADGRVGGGEGNFYCTLNLGVIDRLHLVKFAAAVNSNAPIKPGNDGESAYIVLCSAKLCRSLISLECGRDKTCKHGTPTIPKDLQHHFYRGFFDGDGSIFPMPKNHSWRFDVLGSPRFIRRFQNWLMDRAAVGRTKLLTPHNCPGARSLRYTGGKQIERICRVLYEDATIWLPRKYDEVQKLYARRKKLGPRSRNEV